jgi:hypothetical protein
METKPKRKQKSGQVNWLLLPVRMEFVAPLPLDACITRLRQRDQHGWTFPKVPVEIAPVNDDATEFRIQSQGRLATLEADGILERWDESSTLVTGTIRTPANPYWIMTAALTLPPLLLLAVERNPRALAFMPEYLLLAAFIAFVTILVTSLQRGHLAQVIANTLTD